MKWEISFKEGSSPLGPTKQILEICRNVHWKPNKKRNEQIVVYWEKLVMKRIKGFSVQIKGNNFVNLIRDNKTDNKHNSELINQKVF